MDKTSGIIPGLREFTGLIPGELFQLCGKDGRILGDSMESKPPTDEPQKPKSRRRSVTIVIAGVFVILLSTLLIIVFAFPSRISADNYLKIKRGMTKGEVNSLLGQADSIEHRDERPSVPFIGGAPEREICEYGTGHQRIRIVYANDKVYRKYLMEYSNDSDQPKVIDGR